MISMWTVTGGIFVAGAACSSGQTMTQADDGGDGSTVDMDPTVDAGGDVEITIALGAPEQLLMPGQLGLDSVPDVQLSFLRQADGSNHVFIGGSVDRFSGATAVLATNDFTTFTPVFSADAGVAAPVFGASAATPCAVGVPGAATFDAQYAAPGTVFEAANGNDLMMVYHAENHTFGADCYKTLPFYAAIGLARSTDSGQSWTRVGEIIRGQDPQPSAAPSLTGGWGAAVPTSIVADDYIYTFYSDYPVPGRGHSAGNPITVARAPRTTDGSVGTWKKWHAGAFESDGLTGESTPVLELSDPSSTCVFPRQPGISFNDYIHAYVLTMVCGAGWYFSSSPDLTTQKWSAPKQFFSAPFDNQMLQTGNEYDWHVALVTPGQASGQVTERTGYALWSRGGEPNTPIHMLWRQTFMIGP